MSPSISFSKKKYITPALPPRALASPPPPPTLASSHRRHRVMGYKDVASSTSAVATHGKQQSGSMRSWRCRRRLPSISWCGGRAARWRCPGWHFGGRNPLQIQRTGAAAMKSRSRWRCHQGCSPMRRAVTSSISSQGWSCTCEWWE
jgi:hypothetical protein